MKNACASESWPATPTSSVSPMAPIAALMVNRPVCSQKASAYCGSHSSRAASAIQRSPTIAFVLDTTQLPRPEQPGGPPQQDHEQHHSPYDVRQPPAEECDASLVAASPAL